MGSTIFLKLILNRIKILGIKYVRKAIKSHTSIYNIILIAYIINFIIHFTYKVSYS